MYIYFCSHVLFATTELVSSKLVTRVKTFLHQYSRRWWVDPFFELKRYVVCSYEFYIVIVFIITPSIKLQALQENVVLKEIMCGDEAAAVRASLDCKYPVSYLLCNVLMMYIPLNVVNISLYIISESEFDSESNNQFA